MGLKLMDRCGLVAIILCLFLALMCASGAPAAGQVAPVPTPVEPGEMVPDSASASDESAAQEPSVAKTESEPDTAPILEVDPDNPFKAREPATSPARVVLMREGRRLFDHAGRILRQGPETMFAFESGLAPLPLLPCKAMERAEDLSDYGRRATTFRVSGTVNEYRDRNYFLLTDRLRLADEKVATPAAPPPAEVVPPAAESGQQKDSASARDRDQPPPPSDVAIPAPQQITRPAVAQPAPKPAQPSTAPPEREGKWLIDREGRLDRRDNRTVFVFDSGDPAVTLLPNKKLQQMEDLADFGDRPVRFRISGMITEYRGRNYVVLSKAVVIPKEMEKL